MHNPDNGDILIGAATAARRLNIDVRTLKKYTTEGRITCTVTQSGRRMYCIADIDTMKNEPPRWPPMAPKKEAGK